MKRTLIIILTLILVISGCGTPEVIEETSTGETVKEVEQEPYIDEISDKIQFEDYYNKLDSILIDLRKTKSPQIKKDFISIIAELQSKNPTLIEKYDERINEIEANNLDNSQYLNKLRDCYEKRSKAIGLTNEFLPKYKNIMSYIANTRTMFTSLSSVTLVINEYVDYSNNYEKEKGLEALDRIEKIIDIMERDFTESKKHISFFNHQKSIAAYIENIKLMIDKDRAAWNTKLGSNENMDLFDEGTEYIEKAYEAQQIIRDTTYDEEVEWFVSEIETPMNNAIGSFNQAINACNDAEKLI